MLSLDIFGFQALWSPYFLSFLLLVIVGYFLIAVKYRENFNGSEPVKAKQAVYFTLAMVILYAVKGSPLDLMGHLMFYPHMIQMAILCLVVPPLMIVGIPAWMWSKVLHLRFIRPTFWLLTKPIIALIVFNGIFSIYHIPLIFDTIKQNMWLHAIYTGILFLTAIFMWWPLINQHSGYQTLSGIIKVGYIFAGGILLTPACALIIFAETPMYMTYTDPHAWGEAMKLCVPPSTLANLHLSGPELFNSMSPVHDQQLGGVIMKVIQEIVYGVVLGQVFFEWYRKDQADSAKEMANAMKTSTLE